MSRIRTIKPEFWRNEDLSTVSPEAVLLAIGLLNHCDDEGYFDANPMLIKADIFPLRELSCSTTVLLHELVDIGYISLFEVKNPQKNKIYGHITNFKKHQVINKPVTSKIKDLDLLPYNYGSGKVALPIGKERKGKEGEHGKEDKPEKNSGFALVEKKLSEREILLMHGVTGQVADDFLNVRKKKRLPLTETAMFGIVEEAEKAGLSVLEAVTIATKKSWGGFDSTWDWPGKQKQAANGRFQITREMIYDTNF